MTNAAENNILQVDVESFVVLQDTARQLGQSMQLFLAESVRRGIDILECADSDPGPRPLYLGFAVGDSFCDLYPLDPLGADAETVDDPLLPPPLSAEMVDMEALFQQDRTTRTLPLHPDAATILTNEATNRNVQRADMLNAFIFFNTEWHRAQINGYPIFIRDADGGDSILGEAH